ncbi:hypothetical protein SteCoe_38698 [Stentor coeruleus]|uniref:Uncharacterized protein n=1 Tax=Stentor coeruleus TaxID=5963 RepID=A0A1R2AL78_9CILI|nr:hypothetical protein SteCoe_38698 [Stentor coeruleus]
MPSCLFGIMAYVTLEEQQIEKSFVKRYFFIKRFLTILWIFETLSVSITGYFNKDPFSSIIKIISFSLAGIFLDCFFLDFIWKCYVCLENEEPCGRIMTLSESSIASYPAASTIIIAVEIKETQGDIEYTNENQIKPCQPIIHDFTLDNFSINIGNNLSGSQV